MRELVGMMIEDPVMMIKLILGFGVILAILAAIAFLIYLGISFVVSLSPLTLILVYLIWKV